MDILLRKTRDDHGSVRRMTARALAVMAWPRDAWDAVLALLRDGDASVRRAAAELAVFAGAVGSAPPGAWESFLALLRDGDASVRVAVAGRLVRLRAGSRRPESWSCWRDRIRRRPAHGAFLALLRDDDANVRVAAAGLRWVCWRG